MGLDSQRDEALNELFANMPPEMDTLVDLPSKGMFYTNYKGVKVMPLKFEDEYRILLSKDKNVNPVMSIIEKCTEGLRMPDLLAADKLYLLLKIREISYGSDYKFDVVCPSCGENTLTTLNIAQHLNVTYFPQTLTDPRTVKLPLLKADVEVRFPRSSDDIYMENSEDASKNLHRFVVSINGNNDPVFIAKAIQKMHIRDLKTITKEIHRRDLGVDTTFRFECPKCKFNSKLEVPLDANFFSVN